MIARISRKCVGASALVLAMALAVPLAAQEADESELDKLDTEKPVAPVKVEPAGAVELRDAVRRISYRPTDSYALTDAGYASLKLGDAEAAFNFFTRAGQLQPSDARIKAGLGAAMVRRENPFEALRMFDDAVKFGANEKSIAFDRAIAFDLLGNFERAQQDYQSARGYATSDELVRRQAISLSLLGRTTDADAMLALLLQRNDPEAWRARAFMLAARGDPKEAEKIARGFLPENDVRRLEYYFRQMARLTPAQQAAALHFGHFPVGPAIGQDSEQLRTVAASTGVKPRVVTGDGRLIPSGEPLGTKVAKGKDDKKSRTKKPSNSDVRLAKRDAVPSAVSTASAQAAIDRAAIARPVAVASLPPPDSARPLVRIILPPAKPVVPAATPVIIAPPVTTVAIATPAIEKPVVPSVASAAILTPAQGVIPTALPPVIAPAVIVAPAPKPEVVVATVAVSKPEIAPQPKAEIAVAPAIQPPVLLPPAMAKPANGSDNGPGFAVLEPPPVVAATPNNVAPATNIASTASAVVTEKPKPMGPQQGPTPDGSAVTETIRPIANPESTPAIIETVNTPVAVANVPVPVPAPPAAAPGFDLGSVVESINIPASEQVRAVAPVDLKAIKPVAQKAALTKADATKADVAVKGAKAPKLPASPARFWVQLATGSDINGLSFDYRRLSKKTPQLFAAVSGHTAAWGKSRRLLAGPFADMKAAKKWEADFRKSGGNGFVWQSENGAVVDPLKGK